MTERYIVSRKETAICEAAATGTTSIAATRMMPSTCIAPTTTTAVITTNSVL